MKKYLVLGEPVVGRTGGETVVGVTAEMRPKPAVDLAIVNEGELHRTVWSCPEMARAFVRGGADGHHAGQHAWDRKEIIPL